MQEHRLLGTIKSVPERQVQVEFRKINHASTNGFVTDARFPRREKEEHLSRREKSQTESHFANFFSILLLHSCNVSNPFTFPRP